MKLTDKIQEKISERNKLFLALDIIFTLSTVIFAIWSIWISIPVLFGERIPTYDPTVLPFAMTFSLGMSYAVRVAEMVFSGKRKYLDNSARHPNNSELC